MDEGDWGGRWGGITATAEATTKTKVGKKNQNQHQAQTHNKTNHVMKPAAPAVADNNPQTPNTAAADGMGGTTGWDDDDPWAQMNKTQRYSRDHKLYLNILF